MQRNEVKNLHEGTFFVWKGRSYLKLRDGMVRGEPFVFAQDTGNSKTYVIMGNEVVMICA